MSRGGFLSLTEICLVYHGQEMVKSILQYVYLGELHVPNFHKIFNLTRSSYCVPIKMMSSIYRYFYFDNFELALEPMDENKIGVKF